MRKAKAVRKRKARNALAKAMRHRLLQSKKAEAKKAGAPPAEEPEARCEDEAAEGVVVQA